MAWRLPRWSLFMACLRRKEPPSAPKGALGLWRIRLEMIESSSSVNLFSFWSWFLRLFFVMRWFSWGLKKLPSMQIKSGNLLLLTLSTLVTNYNWKLRKLHLGERHCKLNPKIQKYILPTIDIVANIKKEIRWEIEQKIIFILSKKQWRKSNKKGYYWFFFKG